MLKRKKDNTHYDESINLLTSKILWYHQKLDVNLLMFASLEKEEKNTFLIDIFNKLQKKADFDCAMHHIYSGEAEFPVIDFDHDLNIIFLDNILKNPHLLRVSDLPDKTFLLLKASETRRADANKAKEVLLTAGVEVNGAILQNFLEKVPGFIKRIFF